VFVQQCWAFSATESIESALYLSSGQMLTLSPQNVLECTPNPQHCGGTGGCEGAIAELAFQWAQGGIADINTVPYLGHDAPCDASVKKAAKTGGFIKLPENDGNALMEALATVGPISISVDASSWSFYGGGIYNGCNAAAPDIDHAVQAVGYGTDSTGQGYWIVRNSWSAGWGEQGFIRLYRGPNETCGTDSTPGDGSGCTGGPSVVKVCGTCGIWYDNSYPVNVTLA
jgi:cathepsin L